MKKISFFIGILFLPFWAHAQNDNSWEVGLNIAPFYFDRTDTNPNYKKDRQSLLNGFSFGLHLGKDLTSRWGGELGVEYSIQNTKNVISDNSNTFLDINFNYLKIPFTVRFTTSLGPDQSWFLIFKQGVQVSFLTDYKTRYYNVLGQFSKTIFTPGEINRYNPDGELISNLSEYWPYKKMTFGLAGGVGLKKYISDSWSVSANLFYNYDLTDADRKPLIRSQEQLESNWTMKPTHNIRIGLQVGLQYHFNFGTPTHVEGIL